MKTKLIISGLALMALTALAYGQDNKTGVVSHNSKGQQGIAYVDGNNNNICDNLENRSSNASSFQRSGNLNRCGQGRRNGTGMRGRGQGQCRGRGRNFVDANKNGVCDNNEVTSVK